jgi:hypothetical protein
MRKIISVISVILSIAGSNGIAKTVDHILLGNKQSETEHSFSGDETIVIHGEYDVPGRKILKPKKENWQSAPMTFKLKVNPDKRNYVTVKFWGGDVTHDHMVMFIDGKQMGYMHLGDYDILDYEQCEPRDAPLSTNPNPQYPGRFTYTTFLLPEAATKGKSEIEIAIRATGKIWGYGQNFQQFQKNVTQDSRGVYAVYVHQNPYLEPSVEDLDRIVVKPPVPQTDVPAIDLDAVKKRIEREINKSLNADPKRDEWRLTFVAEAYRVPWCSAYCNPKAVEFTMNAIDHMARLYAKEPGKVVTKGSWIGRSAQAKALILMEDALSPYLDKLIDDGSGKKVKRRDLWCDMFEASTFQLVRDRRWLANQSQIVDNSGHLNNRATHILNKKRGVPLDVTLKFVKESLGILPWSHGVNPDLSIFDPGNTPGENYYQLTKKYLSKEWGYVGNYGESTIWTSAGIYESTMDYNTGKGDPDVYKVMENAAVARTIFRYPSVTVNNNPVMRLEVYIDWRNAHFPGAPTYVAEGIDLRTLYYTGNAHLLGCFKDMISDGYFQRAVHESVYGRKRPDFVALLHLPERYAHISAMMKDVKGGMPMRGDKDFVFSDEEIAVVAVKCGDDVLFAELYWRAKRGINNLAKIHLVTPKSEHVATIHQEQEFIPTGKFNIEQDWVVYGFRGNRFKYPGGYYKQLNAGMKIPIAEHSKDTTFIGRAEFYRCSYGPYEIGLNYSRKNKTYKMIVPPGEYRILPDGPVVKSGTELSVKPHSTIVLRKK